MLKSREALEKMDEYVKLELSIPGLSNFKLLRGCIISLAPVHEMH
jgi:hypothetical protein